MKSNSIKIVLKFIFAFGLIYWLVSSGKLDFGILSKAMQSPFKMLAGLSCLILISLGIAWRWKYILEARLDYKLSYYQMLKCNWIGLFFNSVLPGSVTGDFVKILYIKQEDGRLSTRYLLGSVVLDRVVGLFGLITMLGIFSLVNYKEMTELSVPVQRIILFNLLLFTCVLLGFISLYFFEAVPRAILTKIEHIDILHKIGSKLLKIWDELCLIRKRLIFLTLASVLVHITAVYVFWLVTSPFASHTFELHYAFSFVPIGFVTLAIPIAPSGLGVGHAAFDYLFSFFGINNGASLFNIFFFLQIFVNLLGAIPYLFSKNIRAGHVRDQIQLED